MDDEEFASQATARRLLNTKVKEHMKEFGGCECIALVFVPPGGIDQCLVANEFAMCERASIHTQLDSIAQDGYYKGVEYNHLLKQYFNFTSNTSSNSNNGETAANSTNSSTPEKNKSSNNNNNNNSNNSEQQLSSLTSMSMPQKDVEHFDQIIVKKIPLFVNRKPHEFNHQALFIDAHLLFEYNSEDRKLHLKRGKECWETLLSSWVKWKRNARIVILYDQEMFRTALNIPANAM